MSIRIVKGVYFLLITFLVVCDKVFSEVTILTTSIVEQDGYPIESHEVITEDGYILVAFRIPYSPKNQTQENNRPVAIMQHGFIASSTDWVIAGPDIALSYLLSDRGFDIWMLNSRGNVYSNRSTNKTPNSPNYWDFSFHEMGIYDLPAFFEYIADSTGSREFHYFAHSQGTTAFMILCSSFPQYNSWIKSAHLLAPVVFDANIRSLPVIALGPLLGLPNDPLSLIPFNIGANTDLFQIVSSNFCKDDSIVQNICLSALFALVGPSEFFNTSLIPILNNIYPAGSSSKQALHYFQLYDSGKFRAYDYGVTNFFRYKTLEPPDYDLDKVTVPTYLYYSESDYFSVQFDVLRLAVTLPDGVVRGVFKVEPKYWNHIDFLFGEGVKDFVYAQVLEDLNENL